MGSIPYTPCAMYVKKNAWSVLGLVDKISPAFELRNSGVPAVVRSFQLWVGIRRYYKEVRQAHPDKWKALAQHVGGTRTSDSIRQHLRRTKKQ